MKTNETQNSNVRPKTNRKNKAWMRNPDQLKRPKVFSVKMLRLPNGDFQVLGGESQYLKRINQNAAEWVKVDTRDLTVELRNSRLRSL